MTTPYSRAALLLVLATSSCAAPARMVPIPRFDAAPAHAVAPDPLVEKRFTQGIQPLDDARSIHYLQFFGGGGAAIGVLFGPLGVVANVRAIERATAADVAILKGKLPLDPLAMEREVARGIPELMAAAPDASAVRLTPEVVVVRMKDDRLLFGSTLLVDYGPIGRSWKRTYVHQSAFTATKAEVAQGLTPAQLRDLEAQLRAGFQAVTALYLEELHGTASRIGEVKFKSEFVTPRVQIEFTAEELSGPADRLVARVALTTYSLPRSGVLVPSVAAALQAAPSPAAVAPAAIVPAEPFAPPPPGALAIEFATADTTREGGLVNQTTYSDRRDDVAVTGRTFANGVLTVSGQVGFGKGSQYGGMGPNWDIQPSAGPIDATRFKSVTFRLASTARKLRLRLVGSEREVREGGCYPIFVVDVSDQLRAYTIPLANFAPEGWCGKKARHVRETLPSLIGFEIVSTEVANRPITISVGSTTLVP